MADLFSEPFEEPADDPVPEPRRAPQRRVLTVSQVNATVRRLIESELRDVWIEGEISNCRVWNTGHMYFTLKDESAQIKAVMFRTAMRYLRFKPEDGLHVVARGRLGVYEPKGEYQLVCEHLAHRLVGKQREVFEHTAEPVRAIRLVESFTKLRQLAQQT